MWVDEFHCHLRILEVKTGISVSFIFIHKRVWLQRGGCLPLLLNLSPICSPGMALFSGTLKSEKEGSAGRLVLAPAGWYVPVLRQLDFMTEQVGQTPWEGQELPFMSGVQSNTGTGAQVMCSLHPWRFSGPNCKRPWATWYTFDVNCVWRREFD